MRIRYCIISALTISLIASAPLNASAEALNDSFCSAEEIDEDIDNVNTYDEDLNDDFISNGSVEDTEVFSSQMEAYSSDEDDSTTDGWTPLKKEPKIIHPIPWTPEDTVYIVIFLKCQNDPGHWNIVE